ncbi:hypothetical protein [Sphingomonas colocasiae]|uniref:Chemotaxis protein n=1 Tax=Sphingomonas colocasiae TaxID=1848973 RepID=A0ABS7PL00_9SPHN|nr:hypothetical protein [Sphingomonas colocasiae]MBY8821923.1 hypothetical protein [Sphingomonas colocasiae]
MDALIIGPVAGLAGAALSALACGWHCGGKIQRRDARIVQLETLVGRLEGDLVRQAGTILARDREIERLTRNARAAGRALGEALAERDAALAGADKPGTKAGRKSGGTGARTTGIQIAATATRTAATVRAATRRRKPAGAA